MSPQEMHREWLLKSTGNRGMLFKITEKQTPSKAAAASTSSSQLLLALCKVPLQVAAVDDACPNSAAVPGQGDRARTFCLMLKSTPSVPESNVPWKNGLIIIEGE